MAKKLNATIDVLAEANNLAKVLADLKLKLPNGMDAAKLNAHVAAAQATNTELAAAKRVVAKLVDTQRTAVKGLRADIKGVRTGVAAVFGDDSAEYEAVGGTRASERK